MENDGLCGAASAPKMRPPNKVKKRPIRTKFHELYTPVDEVLGFGARTIVKTYTSVNTGKEYAVKIISAREHGISRSKCLKEIEIYTILRGHDNIIELIEYFEENTMFYLVFPKMQGGTLLRTIESRGHLTENEASLVISQIADALCYMHTKGIAHRDLKPENILCVYPDQVIPVKLTDFDLGSTIRRSSKQSPISTPKLLTPVGSAEFMAPEIVDCWMDDFSSPYDKKCDLWSLGIILYIILCGYPPFYGNCGRDCGWESGEVCDYCQTHLFHNIQLGQYNFSDDRWENISDSAKDLITHLLVLDPRSRYSAKDVLTHDWIVNEGCSNMVRTSKLAHRQMSAVDLELFAGAAIAVNRLVTLKLSRSAEERNLYYQNPSPKIVNEVDLSPQLYLNAEHCQKSPSILGPGSNANSPVSNPYSPSSQALPPGLNENNNIPAKKASFVIGSPVDSDCELEPTDLVSVRKPDFPELDVESAPHLVIKDPSVASLVSSAAGVTESIHSDLDLLLKKDLQNPMALVQHFSSVPNMEVSRLGQQPLNATAFSQRLSVPDVESANKPVLGDVSSVLAKRRFKKNSGDPDELVATCSTDGAGDL